MSELNIDVTASIDPDENDGYPSCVVVSVDEARHYYEDGVRRHGGCVNLIKRVAGQMPMLLCNECGHTTTLNVPDNGAGYVGESVMVWPRFCANCGKEAVK